jgi:putative ABC transport system substrate-binding protein
MGLISMLYLKTKKSFLLGLWGVVLLGGIFLGSLLDATQKRIYMVHWQDNTRTTLGDSFIHYLKEKYSNIEFIDRFANQDENNLKKFREEIKKIRPDLVYVYGTSGILALAGPYDGVNPEEHITDIPILAVAHGEPEGSKIIEKIGKPTGRNVTGVSHNFPLEKVFVVMKEYAGEIKKIAMLSSNERNSINAADVVKKIAKPMGILADSFLYQMEGGDIRPGSLDDTIISVLKSKPDIVYLLSDTVTANQVSQIVGTFIKYKDIHAAPIFATLEPIILTNQGSLFGLFVSYHSMGIIAGVKAEQILFKETKVSEIPYEVGSEMTLVIRQDTMNKLRVYPTISLLETAQILKEGREK